MRGAFRQVALMQVRRRHGNAEALDQPHEIFGADILAAKYEHHVIQPDIVDALERRVVERIDVEAANFRAQSGFAGDYVELRTGRVLVCERGISHGRSFGLRVTVVTSKT